MSRKLISNKTNIETRKIILPSAKIPCSWPECPKRFFSLKYLGKHLKFHTQSLHKCNYCNGQFQTPSNLNRHIRIHTGEKPHTCSLCPQSFSRIDALQVHMRTHTSEKPYSCKICGKSFAHSHSLTVHQRIHIGDKPYSCEICGKAFSQLINLVVHQRIHNGDKPYKCAFCSKSFSQINTLTDHVRIHTGERPYNCKICSQTFAQHSALHSHMGKHTDNPRHAHSIGGKWNIRNRNYTEIRKVEKSEEQQESTNCKQQAKQMHKEDVRRRNKGFSMGATTTRMQTKYKENVKQLSSSTCQACHVVIPSLENLCRHYSLQHNLPQVVMSNLVIPEKILLHNF